MSSTDRGSARRAALVAVAAPTACALLALIAWRASPYGGYLEHDNRPAGAAGEVAAFALFLGGWLLHEHGDDASDRRRPAR